MNKITPRRPSAVERTGRDGEWIPMFTGSAGFLSVGPPRSEEEFVEMELADLALFLNGRLTDLGRSGVRATNVKSLDAAGVGDLAFLWSDRYRESAQKSQAEAIVCGTALPGKTCIVVADPEAAMLSLLGEVYRRRHPRLCPGVDTRAIVSPEARLGSDVAIHAGAIVEAGAVIGARCQILGGAYVGRDVLLGEDCTLHPNATVLDHCRLGDRVTIWSGAIIGKDGFGFLQKDGGHVRVPQIGTVIIEDDVEIGALTTVARGAIDDTVIRRGVIVDDHCHIAHGCQIGEYSVLVGRTAMGGSVTVGKGCFLLQDSAVSTGRTVGDGAILGSGARVLYKDVPAGETVQRPAMTHPAMTAKRIEATLPRLPEMRTRLKRLEKAVQALAE